MAGRRSKKDAPMSVIQLDALPTAGRGRERTPSQYETELVKSATENIVLGVLYDGSEKDFKRVCKELKRGARHHGYGLHGLTPVETDGQTYVAFKATPERRKYNRTPSTDNSEQSSNDTSAA